MPISKEHLGSYVPKQKVKVTKCSDQSFWYKEKLGNVYQVRYIDKDEVIVTASDGYSNIIKTQDCEFIDG